MTTKDISVNISDSDAGGVIEVGPEKGDLDTVVISGTFTAGTLTLEGYRSKGWAPVSGGEFTLVGIYSNRVSNITKYRVEVSTDFQGDVWVELG